MKKTLFLVCILVIGIAFTIQNPSLLDAAPAPKPAAKINWMGFDKAASYMKDKPKKVYIDIYTTSCHWCKVMDKKTLSNPNVVKYLNENFYCIKFNAESKADITFKGIVYHYDKKRRVHELAIELLKGKLSFPASVFHEERFKSGQPVWGYLKVKELEMILKYMGEGKNKTTPWSKYQEAFKPKWK